MTPDRIVRKILLHSPRERVWRALSDSAEFGQWFGVRFEGHFSPGAHISGVVVPTTVDPEVAKAQKPHEGKPFEITVEQMVPEKVFSFRWHPFAVDPGVDYSVEPTTLVEFTLEDAEGGAPLTVTESGFDQIPLSRRAKAFTGNEQGWTMVIKLIEAYLRKVAN